MKCQFTALSLAVLTSTSWAAANIVDIAWTADGHFNHVATVAPKQLLEVCGKLALGQVVTWSFESSSALPFNIHVHQGKSVVYPARLERVDRAQGRQTFEAEAAHCWMWTNTSALPVRVQVDLQR